MWAGSAVRIETRSARSLGEENESRRAGEGERNLELALLAVRQFANQTVGHHLEVNERDKVADQLHDGIARPRTQQGEAAAQHSAAGEIDVVAHRKALEQQRNLIGAAQPPANALVGWQRGDVLTEEPHGS